MGDHRHGGASPQEKFLPPSGELLHNYTGDREAAPKAKSGLPKAEQQGRTSEASRGLLLEILFRPQRDTTTTRSRGRQHSHKSTQAGDRFLLMTLGFLRYLVRTTATDECQRSFGTGVNAPGDPPGMFDRHGGTCRTGEETTKSAAGQPRERPQTANPLPTWNEVATVLENVALYSSKHELHGRLCDTLSPVVCKILVHIIAEVFEPPPCTRHRRRQRSSEDEEVGYTIPSPFDFGSFLGSTVRDVLALRPCSTQSKPVGGTTRGGEGHISQNCDLSAASRPEDDMRELARGDNWLHSYQGGNRRRDRGAYRLPAGRLAHDSLIEIGDRKDDGTSTKGHTSATPNTGAMMVGAVDSVSSEGRYSTNTFMSEDGPVLSRPTVGVVHTVRRQCDEGEGVDGIGSGERDVSDDETDRSSGVRNISPGGVETIPGTKGRAAWRGDQGESVRDGHPRGRRTTSPFPCDVDFSVLAEMQRANPHVVFPGLARDARIFADALIRLAESVDGSVSSANA